MRNGSRAATIVAAVLAGVALTGCRGTSTPSPVAQSQTPESASTSSPAASPTPRSNPSLTPTPLPTAGEVDALFRAGDYEGAAAAYAALAETAPSADERARALLGVAVARRAAGQTDAALAAALEAEQAADPDGEVAKQAAFLRGRYLAEAGLHAEAVAALSPLADAGAGVLQPFVLTELQHAALGAGDQSLADATAAKLQEAAGVPSGLRDAAQRANVLAALLSGNSARHIIELEKLVAISGYARDRWQLAEAYAEAGRDGERLALLRGIVGDSPADSHAGLALDALKEAGERIEPLREGFVLYRARRYVDAEAVLAPAVATRDTLPPADQAFATYYLAASLEDQGRFAEAVALYDQVLNLDPGSPYGHRAQYWAARVLESMEEYTSASARYVELVNVGPAGEFSEEASFRAGYVLYTLGDSAGAAAAWAALEEADARVLFWRGMAERQLGNEAAARASFDAAIAAGPLDFHGVEAARLTGQSGTLDVGFRERELGTAVDWAEIEAWLRMHEGGEPIVAAPSAAPVLAMLGLRDEAADTIYASIPDGASSWDVLAAARQAYDLGLRSVAARLGERLRAGQEAEWQDAPAALLTLAYPVDFPAILEAEAREASLDPLFLAALIRVESYWEPTAVSPVGALGLTQVMPATGEAIAGALNVEGFTVDALLRPATSLRFGAFYIGEQVAAFGNPFVALAAYNGGPSRAARWVNEWDGESAASFAEAVDIQETRHYVELVLETYARYERAYPEIAR